MKEFKNKHHGIITSDNFEDIANQILFDFMEDPSFLYYPTKEEAEERGICTGMQYYTDRAMRLYDRYVDRLSKLTAHWPDEVFSISASNVLEDDEGFC